MRKKQVIRTESYVTKNGQLVRFDDLTLEEKRIAAMDCNGRKERSVQSRGNERAEKSASFTLPRPRSNRLLEG